MAQETYNHSYKTIVNLISQCLDYEKEKGFNTFIVKKLKNLRDKYPDEVIEETVKNEGWRIKGRNFKNEYQKISYFFAIITNNIYFYNKKYLQKKTFNDNNKLQNENNFITEDITESIKNKTTKNNSRDISSILEDFE